MQIHDLSFEPFVPAEELQALVFKLAAQINADYVDKELTCLIVLNGSFIFAADLVRLLKMNLLTSFVKVSSYQGVSSTGVIKTLIGINTEEIQGKHVLLIEDIVDTGNTIVQLLSDIEKYTPASVKVATLFFKPSIYKQTAKIDYIGKSIADDFIVGYGLDYNGLGRKLSSVYKRITN